MATLSITDSSATSSEDASNPDSPDNPAMNNDLLHHLNGSKCSKPNQQVPNNNNNTNHNKNKQVRKDSKCIFYAYILFCIRITTFTLELMIAHCYFFSFCSQETVCNAPPLAWPWNVNSQIAATQQTETTNAPPPLTLSKSSILSENKTNCGAGTRNKRNHTADTVGSTVNKRNRSSNNNNGNASGIFFSA